MDKYKSLIAYTVVFIAGIGLYSSLIQPLFQVEKTTTVTIKQGVVTFKSNVNHDGDKYFIIQNEDTVSKGVVINGEWE